jgi:CheY-like chemotaxis protein
MDTITTVLVAEDNEDDAIIMQHAFKQNGLMRPPQIVRDGADAIAYLHGDGIYADRIVHTYPNILILDLKMPRVSGFDVLEWINEHPDYRVIPTIVWSASADRRDVKHAFCLGAHGYLCKPTSFDEFVAMVGRMFAFWNDCQKPGVEPSEPTCESMRKSASPSPAPTSIESATV